MNERRRGGRRQDLAEARVALDGGGVVALPTTDGWVVAARADRPDAFSRLEVLAPRTEGRHFLVGDSEQARSLARQWSIETQRLVDRCWPGPLTIALRSADDEGDVIEVGMAAPRPLQRLCRTCGPWRIAGLLGQSPHDLASKFPELVIGPGHEPRPAAIAPTLVDCTSSSPQVLRQGALPAAFIEATLLMAARRPRWRSSRP